MPLANITVCETNAPGCGTPGTPMASYAYTLGKAGNRLSVTELSGHTVSYTYDDLYRLTSETIAGASSQNGTVGYSYDPVGNRKQLSSTVPAIPASGLLNVVCPERSRRNFENRLVQAGGVQIVGACPELRRRNGDGNRVQETVAGTSTFYLISEINPTGYPQVLQEQSVTGVFQKSYQWGLELLDSITAVFVPVTPFFSQEVFVPAWYGHDGHGSVRYLTDGAGKITDTYDYDAFGNLLSSTGSSVNNYLFAGEWFDPALGIYYNRARYYDERRGRFWSIDTEEGIPGDPSSLHKYLYATNNPIDRVDPTGHEALEDALFAAAITTTIANIATSAIALHGLSQAADQNLVPDWGIVSLSATTGSQAGLGEFGVDVLFNATEADVFIAPSIGISPLTLFNKFKWKLGTSFLIEAVFGVLRAEEYEEFEAVATWPLSIINLIPGALFHKPKAWGAITQLAKNEHNVSSSNLVLRLGFGSSGSSLVEVGPRSNDFSWTVGYHFGPFNLNDAFSQWKDLLSSFDFPGIWATLNAGN